MQRDRKGVRSGRGGGGGGRGTGRRGRGRRLLLHTQVGQMVPVTCKDGNL